MEELFVAGEQLEQPSFVFNGADCAELSQLQLALMGTGLAETMPF